MESYNYLNFYRPPNKFKKLWKRYENYLAAGEDEKAEDVYIEIAEQVGIIYTTETKKIGGQEVDVPVTEFREIDFVEFILASFTAICVGENVAMRDYAAHMYVFLSPGIYLSFFKSVIDTIDKNVWSVRREKEYAVRFFRSIELKMPTWEIPKGKVVFNNGVFDVQTMRFNPGEHPEVLNFHCTGYDLPFGEKTNCPVFKQYVWSMFEDQALVDMYQEMYGKTFAYNYVIDKFHVNDGGGRNGKSIGITTLQLLHGVDNCGAATLAQLNSRWGPSMVYNKVLNICSEDNDMVSESGTIKRISGGDRHYIDLKGIQGFEAVISLSIIINTNSIYFNDRSHGFAERMIAIPFDFTFTDEPRPNTNERKKDPTLQEKLAKEVPYIALWALEGLKRLVENNWHFTTCERAEKLKLRILKDSNPVLDFYEECVQVNSASRVKKSEAYNLFKEYVTKHNSNVGGVVSANKFHNSFGTLLDKNGGLTSSVPIRVDGNYYYNNISITI